MSDERKDQAQLDAEARERAEKAGVAAPQFVDYEEALGNYQKRDDTESLADRRQREAGEDFRAKKVEGVVTSDQAAPKKAAPKKSDEK